MESQPLTPPPPPPAHPRMIINKNKSFFVASSLVFPLGVGGHTNFFFFNTSKFYTQLHKQTSQSYSLNIYISMGKMIYKFLYNKNNFKKN